MRRYADIIVHRQLWNSLNNVQLSISFPNICFKLNTYSKIYKLAYQYSKLLKIIDTFDDFTTELDAYIVAIKYIEIPIIKVHIPMYDIEYDISICKNKLIHLINVEYYDDYIKLTSDNANIDLCLFQQIKLLVAITQQKLEKFNAVIIEPNIAELFNL